MSSAEQSPTSESTAAPDGPAAVRSAFERMEQWSGDDFFRALVQELAAAMGTNHACVSEVLVGGNSRTIARWSHGKFADNIESASADPPAPVIGEGPCHFPSGVGQRFPAHPSVESYVGAPLKAHDGSVLAHLCAFDERPLTIDPQKLLMFQIFEARAAAELNRLRYETKLRESEERFRDLFDEAPIAYVHEGLDTKFIRANRTAQRILGITPEEVAGSVGMSFIPERPKRSAECARHLSR